MTNILFKMQTQTHSTNPRVNPIPEETINAILKAIHDTGINPLPFLEMFSAADPLQIFSDCRYLLFQSVYEKYQAEAALGAFRPEMATCSALLYEMFYDIEQDFRNEVM